MRLLMRLLTGLAIAALWAPAGKAQITVIAVTSAASFKSGMPARGSIASIWCIGVQVHGIVLAETLPLPFDLAGVRVWVGGAPAPLFGLAEGPGYQQINVEVPQEAQPGTPFGVDHVQVDVEQNGQRGGNGLPQFLDSPGEFFLWPGTSFGIFQHAADSSLVTPDNPARPGETVVGYLTGMPGTDTWVPTGEPAPSDPPATVPQYNWGSAGSDGYEIYEPANWTAGKFDLIAAEVPLAELTPGWVGVYQIKMVLQPSLGAGDKQIVLVRENYSHFPPTDHTYASSPVILPVR